MADDRHSDLAGGAEASAAPEISDEAAEIVPASVNWASWRNLWQVPTILVSTILIALGLYVAVGDRSQTDFDGALNQVEELVRAGNLETAGHRLARAIGPHLDRATEQQQARFHAVMADWAFATSETAVESAQVQWAKRVAEESERAVTMGFALSPTRLERWAYASITLGDVQSTEARIRDLDGIATSAPQASHAAPATASSEDGENISPALDARIRRNRVLRRLVDASLRQPETSMETMMQVLTEYRRDTLLSAMDEIWAIARQTELRLEAGTTQAAIDRLLVDMRRLESQAGPDDEVSFGELYTLLGRAHFELGEFSDASFNLHRALAEFQGAEAAHGQALALLGQIAVSTGDLSGAFERFDAVVREFVGTPSYAVGLLGRADVQGVLGEHQRSMSDYTMLGEYLGREKPRRDVSRERVAGSLTERHDAALAVGRLDVALAYIDLAERLFEPNDVPAAILIRTASTNRQLADDLLAAAVAAMRGEGATDATIRAAEIDAAVRHEAAIHYKLAAERYIRHARVLAGLPGEDQYWADSLWLAAESFDRAGWHENAIAHLKEYLAGRPADDPRRPEALFRLAQAFQSQSDFEGAVEYYRQVLGEYPRSPLAMQSHVPLAQCYIALKRSAEAENELARVIEGAELLSPAAMDYREALVELGKLHYETKNYPRAIETLDSARRRYPDDDRINEIIYRLADSYRGSAMESREKSADPTIPAAERQRLEQLADQHLRAAMSFFGIAISGFEQNPRRRPEKLQEDLRRFAHLYRADCAYQLGRFQDAIELYDQAARKFADHHASMTALVQIVNCYHQLGEYERAVTAHRRALVRLNQLPDVAFDDPAALLDRQAWKQWLANSPLGVRAAAQMIATPEQDPGG